jgi:hypothetical protein
MPKWLENLNRRCYYMADTGDGGASGGDNGTGPDGNPTDGAGKTDGENKNPDNNGGASIPKYRFDEVNEKYKAVKAELDKINAEKSKQEEQEALKRGEHEKLLAQKDSELEAYKTKEAIRKQREDELTSKNNARVESLKASYGDKWGTVSNLLHDGDDAFITAKTLDAIEAMKPDEKKEGDKQAPKGGSGVPDSNKNQGRLAELKAKAEKGEYLSDRERKELYELIEGKK